MKRLFATLIFVLVSFSAQAQVTAPSTWINEKGSILSVQSLDGATGAFTGTYVNNAPGFQCQGQPYDVGGSAKVNRVNFYVNWKGIAGPNCKTITIWSGSVAGN